MYFYLDYTMRSDAGCTSTDLGLRISQFIKSVVVSVWLRGWKQSLACGLDSSRSRKTVGNAINTRIRRPWRNRGKQQGGKLYFVGVLMNQFLCTDFMKPCHRTLSLCMWATICEQQETLIAKMWSAWESQYLFSLFSFLWWANIAEYRTSSLLILRICKNPLIISRTCTVSLLLMLSMLYCSRLHPSSTCCLYTNLSQSQCLLSEVFLSCIFGFCSSLWSAEYCM